MITLTCKKCGGRMDVTENATIFECEYCQSLQTIPPTNNEKITQMHDRAVHHLRRSEFDKASIVYENIISENEQNAEAHWGLCLCRYGIEYVEDVRSHKRIPTCHRAQFKSILDDPEYLTALEYADPGARALYKEEAEYIDKVQKDILSISAKEEPFDIFICYKETDDETRERTKDSVLAQNLYDSLTKEGYKVFFARITLESKLGTAYEPYIFAALNSAPVMLAIGSKLSHFNAVWVKNEWSRYMALMEQGQKKTLIPCYFDMSPYDLPDAFMHLQAQDMTKIGWEQDLIRGIGKLIKKKSRSITAKAQESVKEVALTGALYVGDAVAGKPHGKGRAVYDGTNDEDQIGYVLPNLRGDEYDGEWDFGERNGRGTYTYRSGGSWSGIWQDGYPTTGSGVLKYENGCQYDGELKDEDFHGMGTFTDINQNRWSGEWKNGKPWNGEGVIYKDLNFIDGVLFKGKMKDGEYDGNGELHCPDGTTYKGSWKNGKYSGYGTITHPDGTSYEGEWQDGIYHGRGICHYADGTSWEGEWRDGQCLTGSGSFQLSADHNKYEGDLRDGKREARGTLHYRNGDTYEGEWRNDLRHGRGVFRTADSRYCYDGEWNNDLYHGFGKLTNTDGTSYEGEWQEGKYHGQGILRYADGTSWEGEWQEGECFTGTGFRKFENGETYEGSIVNGEREGHGVCHYENGNTYEGEWKNGVRHGKGVFRNADGISSYDGEWENDLYHGQGTRVYTDGTYTGQWLDGKRNGKGTFVYKNGKPDQKWEGEWKDDKRFTGEGYIRFNNGSYYGSYLEGELHGEGTYEWDKGDFYKGSWLNGKWNGQGYHKCANGSTYTGEFQDHYYHGKGVFRYNNGDSYDGEWQNGKKHGEGTYVYGKSGEKASWTGTWKEGQELTGYGLIRNYLKPGQKTVNGFVSNCFTKCISHQSFYGELRGGHPHKGILRCYMKDDKGESYCEIYKDGGLSERSSAVYYYSEMGADTTLYPPFRAKNRIAILLAGIVMIIIVMIAIWIVQGIFSFLSDPIGFLFG